jgi:hypothetical protein
MNAVKPPRLAMALLRRFLSNHETLAGDLLEEFAHRRSRLWLWRQLLASIVLVAIRGRRAAQDVRPLRLVDERTSPLQVYDRSPLRPFVNLTASPVHGTGGLGILSLVVLTTVISPGVWSLVVAGLLSGIVCGVVRIARSRRHGLPAADSINHIFIGR